MKRVINKILGVFGLRLSRVVIDKGLPDTSKLYKAQSMSGALFRMRDRGLKASTIIDIGASNGCWSENCMNYFPESKYFLVDAQEPHKPELEIFKLKHSNAEFVISAAGPKKGEIYFDTSELFTGMASDVPFEKNNLVVPVNSIDNWVKEYNLLPPYVIKLDTHGFEVPILNGAIETLKKTDLLIVEVYNYRLSDSALRFYEFCQHMDNLGFLPIEAVDLMQRKKDNSFWQMDIFFVPKSYKNIDYNRYE